MKLSRREFLKAIFNTVPVAALSGPLAMLWPTGGKARPVAEPAVLAVDEDGFLIEPDFHWIVEPELPTRRVNFEYDRMSLAEKAEFLANWTDDEGAWALVEEPVDAWAEPDHACFAALEERQQAWLDGKADVDELSGRELAKDTEYGAGVEIFSTLGPEVAGAIGLREAPFGAPGSGSYGICYGGNIEALNAAFAALGINAVVRGPDDFEDPDGAM